MSGNDITLNIAGFIPHTEANGPGIRGGIWVQGCSLKCPGCFNTELQGHKPRYLVPVNKLIEWILSLKGIEGVTISGGEPFEQAKALSKLIKQIKKNGLSVFVFSGYDFDYLLNSKNEYIRNSLDSIDILCAGPFIQDKYRENLLWRGSTNQKLIYLSKRYDSNMEVEWRKNSPSEEISLINNSFLTTGIKNELINFIEKKTKEKK